MSQQQTPDNLDPTLQPWVPDSLRQRLVVGARVRLVWRPECMLAPGVNHGKQLDGESGTIRETDNLSWPNHPYVVRWDNGKTTCSAALELEPLDEKEGEDA